MKKKMKELIIKQWMALLCCLFVCTSMFANMNMRSQFVAEQDTIKIPSDTTQIDTTGTRDNPAIMLTPSIPSSPQAEAFQRVGEYTINNPYGIPDISIPLYEINHYGYKIPITLRYIATPLKSGYNYDVTGYGWALTSGFCISRTISSLADEQADFKLCSDIINSGSEYFQDYRNSLQTLNYQRDLFKCVLPSGDSFQFYMTKDWSTTISYTLSTKKSYKIEAQISTGQINGFTVIDDSGVIYTFNIIENSTDPQNATRRVGWYLSRIDLPNCTVPITFEYNASIRQYNVQGLEEKVVTMIHNHPSPSSDMVQAIVQDSDQPSYYTSKLLTRIQYGSESLNFTYKNGTTEQEYNYLSKLTITGLKEFHFSYYMTNSFPAYINLARLDRLAVKGLSSTPSDSLVYQFKYKEAIGPFTGTDHWGYLTNDDFVSNNLANMNFYFECNSSFNGQIEYPQVVKSLGTDPDGWCPYQKYRLYYYTPNTERRHAAPPYIHGVLQSITYPSGGKTEFEFENNRFVTATDANGNFVLTKKQRRVIEGGGFRIKTITNYTSNDVVADIRQYRYGPTFKEANTNNLNLPVDPTNMTNQHIGFGEPVVDPNILSYSHFTTSGPSTLPTEIRYMLLGLNQAGIRCNFANPFSQQDYNSSPWRFDVQFSPIFFRSLLGGRNAVAYPETTVYYGDVGSSEQTPQNTIGKTVFKFDIYGEQNDSCYYQVPQYYGHTLDHRIYTTAKDHPTKQIDYAYDGGYFKHQKKDTYTYDDTGGQLQDYVFKNIYSPGYGNLALMSTLFQQRELFPISYRMREKTTTEYYSIDSLATTEAMAYTYNDLVETHTVTGNKLMTTTYTYPSSSNTGLVQKNMMSTVLQSKTRSSIENQQFDVSGYKTDYDYFNNDSQVLPSKAYNLNTTLTSSSFEEIAQVKSYTSNGHPIEVVDRSGMSTFYLWSYNDRYIVAEIKNATATQVNAALSAELSTTIDGLAAASGVTTTNLNKLRNNTNLSGALVTTWTYSPLVGVKSQTDPSGVPTYYSYDSLGRLKEVYRYESNNETYPKRIIKQYTYHNKNN